MKHLLLIFSLTVASVLAHAADPAPPKKAYKFDMTPLKGEVKEFKVSFKNPESEGMVAETEAKLKSGEVLTGQFACNYKNGQAMIQCQRDDDGGEFSFVGSGDDYTLNFERFDMTDEGDEREVVIKSRNPAGEGDSLSGVKE